jgi:hypothetical protein
VWIDFRISFWKIVNYLSLCLNHCDLKNMIFVHQEDDHLIRVRLQSRHTSSRTYLLWIEYSPTQITAWYCKCRAGARVVGVCSHIASLWYLGYARHKRIYLTESGGSITNMSWMMCGDSVTERVSNDHLLDGQKSQNCPLNIPACSWNWVWAGKPHM